MIKYLKRIDYHLIMAILVMLLVIGYISLVQGCASTTRLVANEVDTAIQDHQASTIIILDLWAKHSDYIQAIAYDAIQNLNKKQLADLKRFTKIAKSKKRTNKEIGEAINLVGRALTPILVPAISRYVPELLRLLLVVGVL